MSSTLGRRASRSAAILRTAGSECVRSWRARPGNAESESGTMRCSIWSACATTRPSGSASCASSRSRARAAPYASAATLRQRQSASLEDAAAAVTPAPLSAWATAISACRRNANMLLVSRARSASSAREPRKTPSVVSACTATPISRSATSGTTAGASVESWNDASVRNALMRMCASLSASNRRSPAMAFCGSSFALSSNALLMPRAATMRVCGSGSLSPRTSGAAPSLARRRAKE